MNTVNWGILGTGEVARKFAQGLRYVPGCKLSAVASRSIEKANSFAKKFNVPKAYGTYIELVRDDAIDVVYIATPNNFHKDHSILCIDNYKGVLCEKPFALNLKEAVEVIKYAKEKKVFCMEGMWTRFIPVISKAKSILQSGQIGEIKTFSATFGKLNKFDPFNRLYNKQLGGGSLLDMGVYPLSLALYFLGHPTDVKGFLSFGETGVDEQSSIILMFRDGVQAILASHFRVNYPNTINIYGTRGVITIREPIYRPSSIMIQKYSYSDKLAQKVILRVREKYFGKRINCSVRGNGYNYEAHEVVKCLNMGLIESSMMPWNDTLKVLEIVDELSRNK